MLWRCITDLARTQHGLVTTNQFLSLGGSRSQLRWGVQEGRIEVIRHGVYAVAGSSSPHRDLMAACLAGGKTAAVSHFAAASLWGAEQVTKGRLEITTFDNRQHTLPGITTHRSGLDVESAVCTHLDMPVVVPGLAVAQVARTAHPRLVKSVANDLVMRHWTNWHDISSWADQLGGDRKRDELRLMCERALAIGGHYDSPPARELCQKLLDAGVTDLQLDYQLETPEGILLLDIAIPRPRVVLEYNGAQNHDTALARADDARRRARLSALDWLVIDVDRYSDLDEVVIWTIRAARRRGWRPPGERDGRETRPEDT